MHHSLLVCLGQLVKLLLMHGHKQGLHVARSFLAVNCQQPCLGCTMGLCYEFLAWGAGLQCGTIVSVSALLRRHSIGSAHSGIARPVINNAFSLLQPIPWCYVVLSLLLSPWAPISLPHRTTLTVHCKICGSCNKSKVCILNVPVYLSFTHDLKWLKPNKTAWSKSTSYTTRDIIRCSSHIDSRSRSELLCQHFQWNL